MQKLGQLRKGEILTPQLLSEIFAERLKTLDIPEAKSDVQIFLRDTSQLNEWSIDFFMHWFSQIKFI
jgi:hypothetical protein